MTVFQPELLARLADAYPDEIAWRNLGQDRATLSLREWDRKANRLARGLTDRGVAKGDRVGLAIGNDEPFEWLVSYMGIHRAGAVAVPLLERLGPVEQARCLDHAGASVLLCSRPSDEVRAVVRDVVSTTGGTPTTWGELLGHGDTEVDAGIRADDVADIMYTSGTTGAPKGVVVRHGSLAVAAAPSSWTGLGFLTSSPFATTSGSLLVCGPMRGGLAGWCLPRFSPTGWLDAVARDRPVVAFLVPAMVELLVADPAFETADLSSLAVVNIGSAPIATATLRRFGAGLPGADVLCGYGMTEFGAVSALPLRDGGRHLGSVGLPLPGVEVRIVGEHGEPLPPGEVGEVTVRGDRPAREYLGDAESTARTWVDGWLRSGDLGRIDNDGFLWIEGRSKEMINRGGLNIVPGEVESVFFEHPDVLEAAVVGVPHAVLGEDVAAWVVLRRPVPTDALRTFLLARLADFKVPRRITVVDALPRNESGKVLKQELANESRSSP